MTFTKQKLEESTYSTKIYTAIRDIVMRSFYPALGMDNDDMMAFVNSLLVRFNVYIWESQLQKTQNRSRKTYFRITGFMIAENNVSFGPTGVDEGSIIHLMATVPEARSNGVATSMVQHFVNREMEKTDILVVVMYPKEMRPMAVDMDEMIDM